MNKSRLCCLLVCLVCVSSLVAQATRKVSVSGLIYDLKNPDAERRKEAAVLLGQNKSREAVPTLIEVTGDADQGVRLEVVKALVRINDGRALPAFVRLTKDPVKAIQEKALEGIVAVYVIEGSGFVHGVKKVADFLNPLDDGYDPLVVEPYVSVSPDAVNAMVALLKSEDTDLRREAAAGLGVLRAASAIPQIQEALAGELKEEVKVELIRALYKIGDRQAAESVVPFVRDPEKTVHDEAILTVGRLRVIKAVPDLKDLYESGIQESRKILGVVPVSGKDDLAKRLYQALSYIGDPSCKELFQAGLKDDRVFYRRLGAEGLGRSGDTAHTSLVATQYLREKDPEAKLAMSFALYRLGREEHLLELAQEGDQGLEYLMELDASEMPKLYPYLETEKNAVKARILTAIGQRADRSAVPVVERYMKSENGDVASAANLAIRRLRGRFPPS